MTCIIRLYSCLGTIYNININCILYYNKKFVNVNNYYWRKNAFYFYRLKTNLMKNIIEHIKIVFRLSIYNNFIFYDITLCNWEMYIDRQCFYYT